MFVMQLSQGFKKTMDCKKLNEIFGSLRKYVHSFLISHHYIGLFLKMRFWPTSLVRLSFVSSFLLFTVILLLSLLLGLGDTSYSPYLNFLNQTLNTFIEKILTKAQPLQQHHLYYARLL